MLVEVYLRFLFRCAAGWYLRSVLWQRGLSFFIFFILELLLCLYAHLYVHITTYLPTYFVTVIHLLCYFMLCAFVIYSIKLLFTVFTCMIGELCKGAQLRIYVRVCAFVGLLPHRQELTLDILGLDILCLWSDKTN